MVLSFVTLTGSVLDVLPGIGAFILRIVPMMRAFRGQSCRVVAAGSIAEQQSEWAGY